MTEQGGNVAEGDCSAVVDDWVVTGEDCLFYFGAYVELAKVEDADALEMEGAKDVDGLRD